MNTDLQKRLEEAAKEYAKRVVPECISSYEGFFYYTTADFRNGAKQGFKEAIAEAKKWLMGNARYYVPSAISRQALRIDFERYMNKLLED